MLTWLSRLRGSLPRRRRRPWRCVSGRRHGVGLALLALLVLVAYGYWFGTNDARAQREVARYLAQLTGGHVRLDHAEFSLFGGIRVRNLRVFGSEEIDVPLFQAPQVLISHRPLALLLRGRLEPIEIICVRPRVTLVEDAHTGRFNIQEIFPLARGARGLGAGTKLPAVRLREGELVLLDLEDERLLPVGKRPLPWRVALLPGPEGRVYRLSFEGQEGTIRYSGTIDTVTGANRFTGEMIGLSGLDRALPRKLRKWRRRYKLDGRVSYAGDAHWGDCRRRPVRRNSSI